MPDVPYKMYGATTRCCIVLPTAFRKIFEGLEAESALIVGLLWLPHSMYVFLEARRGIWVCYHLQAMSYVYFVYQHSYQSWSWSHLQRMEGLKQLDG